MAIYEREDVFFERIVRNSGYVMHNMHFHEKNELYYLVSGTTTYFVNNEIFDLKPGDFVFIPKGAFHKTDIGGREVERIRFSFDDAYTGEELRKYIDKLTQNKHITIQPEKRSEIEELISKIEAEENCPSASSQIAEKLCFKLLIIYIARYRYLPDGPLVSETHSLVQNVISHISVNYGGDLSLNVLSKRFGISPNYLSSVFKRTAGIGISEYINITRSAVARNLLESTDMSVTEIATKCGFNGSSYFTQIFKKLYGITPKKYRNNGRPF